MLPSRNEDGLRKRLQQRGGKAQYYIVGAFEMMSAGCSLLTYTKTGNGNTQRRPWLSLARLWVRLCQILRSGLAFILRKTSLKKTEEINDSS